MRTVLVVAALALCACPDKKPTVDENDPLIQKLKAEQDRLSKGGQPGGPGMRSKDDPNPLAEVAQQPPDTPVTVKTKTDSVTVGGLTVTPNRIETAQAVSTAKVKLSTADRFVRLVITVQTSKELTLELSKATLVKGSDVFELARDVQRVGQGSPLAPTIGPSVAQDLVLYFEVPPAQIVPGLTLSLPVGAETLSLPLL